MQAILTLIFFLMKEKRNTEYERISDSGISASWNSSCSAVDLESTEDVGYGENQPLLSSNKDSDHILYTMEKVMYYEQSRKQDKEVSATIIIYYIVCTNEIKCI